MPGCVHTDLLNLGLIPDPYFDRNENLLHWIGRADWRYATSFDADPDVLAYPVQELVFEGLDTVAEVALNGVPLGRADNMHIAWRFDVTGLLRSQGNTLEIVFRSNEAAALAEAARLGDMPRVRPLPYNFIRKMACNYGWDWGPELVTCGIWKPAYLIAHSGARLGQVRPLVTHATPDLATVIVHPDVLGASGCTVDMKLVGPDGMPAAHWSGPAGLPADLNVARPALWWPRSHGPQPLYTLTVTLLRDGEQLDRWEGRIGLRQVRLDTAPDTIGAAFTIEINGKPVFVRGANWIPDDCFPTRVNRSRYSARIDQAIGANMNLLRVWGGGLYETEDFYDLCDEAGILVWQDFAFACACYPEEDPFPAQIEAEARDNVARLSRHPSLVLWSGNNENLWMFQRRTKTAAGQHWDDVVGARGWGKLYYLDMLPRIVADLDPSRPYWPGSPWSGTWDLEANDDRYGNNHDWDPWNSLDHTELRRTRPRFMAEYGHAGPAAWATWKRALPESELTPWSEGLAFHNRAMKGEAKLRTRLLEHFDDPQDFDEWLFLTQLNQARAIRTGAEWHRALKPRCMGTIVWQLTDCWPVTSWAAVDGDGRRKPLWYQLRASYADRLLTIQPDGAGENAALWLHADNETDAVWELVLRMKRIVFDGTILAEERHAMTVGERGKEALVLPASIASPSDPKREMIVVDAADGTPRAIWFFRRDKDLALPAPSLETTVIPDDSDHLVSVTARTLLRELSLFPDRLTPRAEVDSQLITLLPGETHVFRVSGVPEAEAARLCSPPVLTCVTPRSK
ncbi:MAG: glycoside hydrolase family 2 protein [Paracoccaceae bacterium]|nr:glycoside hydrolase family 2 protein [Paracoccaceae bacterium]